jgi:hypothetical protein
MATRKRLSEEARWQWEAAGVIPTADDYEEEEEEED